MTRYRYDLTVAISYTNLSSI